MSCEHKFISVGTRRFCVKCGQDLNEIAKEAEAKGNPKGKRKTAENAKKQAENEVAEDEEV